MEYRAGGGTIVSPETKPIVASLKKAHSRHIRSAQIDAANLGSK